MLRKVILVTIGVVAFGVVSCRKKTKPPPPHVDLPKSVSTTPLRPGFPTVTIRPDGVYLENRLIVAVKDWKIDASEKEGDPDGYFITKLYKAAKAPMKEARRRAKEVPGKEYKIHNTTLTLRAHKQTPYRLFAETIYTLTNADFRSFQLEVRRPDGGSAAVVIRRGRRSENLVDWDKIHVDPGSEFNGLVRYSTGNLKTRHVRRSDLIPVPPAPLEKEVEKAVRVRRARKAIVALLNWGPTCLSQCPLTMSLKVNAQGRVVEYGHPPPSPSDKNSNPSDYEPADGPMRLRETTCTCCLIPWLKRWPQIPAAGIYHVAREPLLKDLAPKRSLPAILKALSSIQPANCSRRLLGLFGVIKSTGFLLRSRFGLECVRSEKTGLCERKPTEARSPSAMWKALGLQLWKSWVRQKKLLPAPLDRHTIILRLALNLPFQSVISALDAAREKPATAEGASGVAGGCRLQYNPERMDWELLAKHRAACMYPFPRLLVF